MSTWKRLALAAGWLFALGAALAAPPAKAPAPVKLTITGSSTLAPVVTELARRFSAQHPEVKIVVQTGGSGRGVSDARAGTADIGMVSRALKPDEKDLFVFTMARDGVALVVQRDNPVTGVTRAQFIDILTGRAAHWKALGGADAPISLISRPAGRGSLETVTQYTRIAEDEIKAAALAGDNAEALKALLANRNALVFMSVGNAEHAVMQGSAIRLLALDNVPAGVVTVQDGRYPMARPLSLVTRAMPSGKVKAFITFALSPQAHGVIEQHEYVPYLD